MRAEVITKDPIINLLELNTSELTYIVEGLRKLHTVSHAPQSLIDLRVKIEYVHETAIKALSNPEVMLTNGGG